RRPLPLPSPLSLHAALPIYPRMPTIRGMRRRGYTPRSIRQFCDMIGVARSDGGVDMGMLEHAVRDDLNSTAPRAMCVLDPLKLRSEEHTSELQSRFDLVCRL